MEKIGGVVEDDGNLRAEGDDVSLSRAVEAQAAGLLRLILADYTGPVAVRLWKGSPLCGAESPPCSLVFRHPAPLRHLLLHQDIVHLGEAYLAGDVVVEGNMEALFDLVEFLRDYAPSWKAKWRILRLALRLPAHDHSADDIDRRARKQANSKAAISHHYDVSNDFYRLWLDPEMVYSCAYFENAGQSLAAAQQDKLDYICRKLRLAPGQALLDIGCGWGALAIWAARHYGVKVDGITLSRNQYDYARERVAREGLESQVSIELRDYRELDAQPRYDRVVSVGMFEHIGVKNFPLYFNTVRRLLRPGGLFLNHGITNDTGWQKTPITQFINRYVFPDGELSRISEVSTAMEEAGFEILDVESLRRHYALTLRHWIKRLEAHREQAINQTSAATYRLWRLYMSGSAYYFDEGSLGVYQVLASPMFEKLALPLRRDDLYDC